MIDRRRQQLAEPAQDAPRPAPTSTEAGTEYTKPEAKEAYLVSVTLSEWEMFFASQVGNMRRLESMRLAFRNRNRGATNSEAEKWYANVAGALGELAAAKALNIYWPPSVNARKSEPDLPPDWQVRCRSQSHYDLVIRPDDPDHFRYILVTGTGPTFQVHGYIKGKDGKRDWWWQDKGGRGAPAYWVPQDALIQFHPPRDTGGENLKYREPGGPSSAHHAT